MMPLKKKWRLLGSKRVENIFVDNIQGGKIGSVLLKDMNEITAPESSMYPLAWRIAGPVFDLASGDAQEM